ncbi:GntR family transcriptional regulator [Tenggerimyces flavus]|uniref:GntR family transcriptional regulator n=1 Tax=Tenggerimyces flavus TaxID=1708749 RepID=A0ABV7YB14_9ACTN|nr:GntR family transcriptional regulator [Tenggerimyces flavus]MBM7785690.1 GntR family transcriptional regulator [Tenggerimyces flavus]
MQSSPPGKVGEIRARLLSLVDNLPEGALLPSERELAAKWQVSRMTLRRAMDELVAEELLIRRQGSGTFTCRPKVVRRLVMTSFSDDMRRRGLTPGSTTLEFRRHRADRGLARRLRIPVGDMVLAFIRLRTADDVPMVVERTSLPDAYVPGLQPEDLNNSWYELLAVRYGVEVATGTSRLEPAMPDTRTAEWLGIPVTQPCLVFRTTVLDGRGRVFETGSAVYRGDRYTLTAELRPPRQVVRPNVGMGPTG